MNFLNSQFHIRFGCNSTQVSHGISFFNSTLLNILPSIYIYEEGKLCKLWNKAQQAQWACWQAQNVHIRMPNEARAHPLAWAPSPDDGPDLPITFQETCSASKRGLPSKPQRLVQQVWVTSSASLWGLLYKERRQDLTTIKRPQHPQKRYA